MNNQEAFNKATKHMLAQGKRSAANDRCLYAGPEGTACAIGCLLPRALGERLDRLVNTAWHNVRRNEAVSAKEERRLLSGCTDEFLISLQDVHDSAAGDFHVEVTDNLKNVAWRFDLELPEELR